MSSLTLGLVVNPIAGVGAALAWKGTDDIDAAWQAVEEGKPQPVWDIVSRALDSIPTHIRISWILGADYPLNVDGTVVSVLPQHSTAQHTIEAVKAITDHDPDLIIFAGGDGTAADVASTTDLPIIGIPAGVKIFSPCFLHRPDDLGSFLLNWEGDTVETDLLDLDEEAYRQGRAEPRLVTSAIIPVSSVVQSGKISLSSSDSETFRLIAERIEDDALLNGKTIIVGPGSTMKNILHQLGLEVSLLGVDIVTKDEVIIFDGTRDQLDQYEIDEIWLSPIGNQGHIFGRGNRQISPEQISRVGPANIRIFSTMEKIRATPTLFVDTGVSKLDKELRGYLSVIVGYHEEIMKKVE